MTTLKGAKYVLCLIAVVALFVRIRSCVSKPNVPREGVRDYSVPLPANDVALIQYTHKNISVQTHAGTTNTYVPEGGKADVTIDKNGDVRVDVKHFGFAYSPVLGVLVTDRLRLAGGLQVLYWNRLEGYVGLAGPGLRGFAGLGYRLDQLHLDNTSIFMAYTTNKEIGGGLLVRF